VLASATAEQEPQWLTISLSTRYISCGTRPKKTDAASIQIVVPSGPNADYFVGKTIPIPVRLTGGAGTAEVPASNAWLRIEAFEDGAQEIRGRMGMRYATGAEKIAPAYELAGEFHAKLCSSSKAQPSAPTLDQERRPVGGKLAGKAREFPNFVAYLRTDSRGEKIVAFKGFTKDVGCYAEGANTPYLHGVEVGAGPQGTFFLGTRVPAEWTMQVSTAETAERSVHAGNGAGTIIIDEAQLKPGGRISGRMQAETIGETDEAWYFSVSGHFDAIVCEQPKGTL
jgi:hypothetical protein